MKARQKDSHLHSSLRKINKIKNSRETTDKKKGGLFGVLEWVGLLIWV